MRNPRTRIRVSLSKRERLTRERTNTCRSLSVHHSSSGLPFVFIYVSILLFRSSWRIRSACFRVVLLVILMPRMTSPFLILIPFRFRLVVTIAALVEAVFTPVPMLPWLLFNVKLAIRSFTSELMTIFCFFFCCFFCTFNSRAVAPANECIDRARLNRLKRYTGGCFRCTVAGAMGRPPTMTPPPVV